MELEIIVTRIDWNVWPIQATLRGCPFHGYGTTVEDAIQDLFTGHCTSEKARELEQPEAVSHG